jgi:hypothetical protein
MFGKRTALLVFGSLSNIQISRFIPSCAVPGLFVLP